MNPQARRIIAARALRDFGDGFVAVLLPLHLALLGYSPALIGLVAGLALLGSAAMTLALGHWGSHLAPRSVLLACAFSMFVTGLAFSGAEARWLILLLAAVGTVNPSAGTASIFVPPEQAALSRAAGEAGRTAGFARYGLAGAMAAALGSLAAASPEGLVRLGLSPLEASRAMFVLYAALGLAGALVYRGLPREAALPRGAGRLGESRRVIHRLALLFSLDSFAGGFAVQSLMALWLFERFGLPLATAATFFFAAGLLGALSQPVAAWLAKRIGLLNTMVWTHIPASLFLAAAALVPSLPLALTLLLLRAALSQMDVPARTAFVMGAVTPAERMAAASFTAVPRALASAAGPVFAGLLIAGGHEAWPLLLCAALKILYDVLLLLRLFHRHAAAQARG